MDHELAIHNGEYSGSIFVLLGCPSHRHGSKSLARSGGVARSLIKGSNGGLCDRSDL